VSKLSENGKSTLRRDKAPKNPNTEVILEKRPRLSFDIDKDDYTWLVSYCQEIAPAVGRVKVNHVWVLRALVKELRRDPDLNLRTIERVREENPL